MHIYVSHLENASRTRVAADKEKIKRLVQNHGKGARYAAVGVAEKRLLEQVGLQGNVDDGAIFPRQVKVILEGVEVLVTISARPASPERRPDPVVVGRRGWRANVDRLNV
jgi:hypothetical protein